jgi:hypothetical protein
MVVATAAMNRDQAEQSSDSRTDRLPGNGQTRLRLGHALPAPGRAGVATIHPRGTARERRPAQRAVGAPKRGRYPTPARARPGPGSAPCPPRGCAGRRLARRPWVHRVGHEQRGVALRFHGLFVHSRCGLCERLRLRSGCTPCRAAGRPAVAAGVSLRTGGEPRLPRTRRRAVGIGRVGPRRTRRAVALRGRRRCAANQHQGRDESKPFPLCHEHDSTLDGSPCGR